MLHSAYVPTKKIVEKLKGDPIMKCPYLVRCAISKCKAAKSSYMPSLFELQEYCGASKNFKKCPFFQNLAAGNKDRLQLLQVS